MRVPTCFNINKLLNSLDSISEHGGKYIHTATITIVKFMKSKFSFIICMVNESTVSYQIIEMVFYKSDIRTLVTLVVVVVNCIICAYNSS